MQSLFSNIPAESQKILLDFDTIVQGVRPLSSKQMQLLPKDIRDLSHLLTDEREDRRFGYMNQTTALTAYVRYYQWWNLVRLTRLFAGIGAEKFNIPENGLCLDIGSGPLTVPIALWIACPSLRSKKLRWYCMDTSQSALSLGEELFLAVAARTAQATGEVVEPWNIVRIKGEMGTAMHNAVDFISCANVFNEMVQSSGKPPEYSAKKALETFSSYSKGKGTFLIIEPGTPPSARFLSALRSALLKKDWNPIFPCPHSEECPMAGKRGGKWCHFVFSAEEGVPPKLKKLSVLAGLPKDRASLSFILAKKGFSNIEAETNAYLERKMQVRIASDLIRLPKGRKGYYGCSKQGLVLVVSRKEDFSLASGDLIDVKIPAYIVKDEKSGATIIDLDPKTEPKDKFKNKPNGKITGERKYERSKN